MALHLILPIVPASTIALPGNPFYAPPDQKKGVIADILFGI